jgi:hypothetical protein
MSLPVIVVTLPNLIETLFPGRRGVLEITSLVVPALALAWRIGIGKRQIASNGCGRLVRSVQIIAFCLGILIIGFIEGVMILARLNPPGNMFNSPKDRNIWLGLAVTYLVLMAVAMYAARDTSPADE